MLSMLWIMWALLYISISAIFTDLSSTSAMLKGTTTEPLWGLKPVTFNLHTIW